jgi:hypothetical protein
VRGPHGSISQTLQKVELWGEGRRAALGPRLSQTFNDQDIIDVIGWIQDKWSGEIYAAWSVWEQQSRTNTQ